ncbi:hypothetical protein ACGFZH_36995 [Streptomyces zaomyceticus]|uniref:hypothetical protein n=1 Tax=Streptomyces zaomyceticus TaxID=68286 RepID=UPI00371ABA7F
MSTPDRNPPADTVRSYLAQAALQPLAVHSPAQYRLSGPVSLAGNALPGVSAAA